MKYLCILFVMAITSLICFGQDSEKSFDDVSRTQAFQGERAENLVKDSTRLAIEARSKSVWIRSLILPGLGQYTNGGFWWLKIPVIYGGFLAGVLTFDFNQQYYKFYLAEAKYRTDNNDAAPPDSPYRGGERFITNSIIETKDYHRRNRDLTVLCMVGWWGLNAVEAYVSDMLKNRWSISSDLSAKVYPTMIPTPLNRYAQVIGIKVKIGFDGSGGKIN